MPAPSVESADAQEISSAATGGWTPPVLSAARSAGSTEGTSG